MFKVETKLFVMLKYRIVLKDILTFLRLNYRDALLITLYLVEIGTGIQKYKKDNYNIQDIVTYSRKTIKFVKQCRQLDNQNGNDSLLKKCNLFIT